MISSLPWKHQPQPACWVPSICLVSCMHHAATATSLTHKFTRCSSMLISGQVLPSGVLPQLEASLCRRALRAPGVS